VIHHLPNGNLITEVFDDEQLSIASPAKAPAGINPRSAEELVCLMN